MLFEVQSEVEVTTTTTVQSPEPEVSYAVQNILDPVAKPIDQPIVSSFSPPRGEISFEWDSSGANLPLNLKTEAETSLQDGNPESKDGGTLKTEEGVPSLVSTLELAGQILSVNSAIIGQHLTKS